MRRVEVVELAQLTRSQLHVLSLLRSIQRNVIRRDITKQGQHAREIIDEMTSHSVR